MAKTRRRVLSILMALVLTLGLLPTAALAEGPEDRGRNDNIVVTVQDRSDNPVSGATVTLYELKWAFGYYWESRGSQPTGADGKVTFQNINKNTTYGVKAASGSAETTIQTVQGSSATLTLNISQSSHTGWQGVFEQDGRSTTVSIYRLYKNSVPTNINQAFGVNQFGPSGNNSPYFEVTVDLEKLSQIDGIGVPEWKYNNDYKTWYWYVSLETIDPTPEQLNGKSESDWFWDQLLSCMNNSDQAKFQEYFNGKYRGYVLKHENDTNPHIDGVVLLNPPAYTVELYVDGSLVVTDDKENGATHTVQKVYELWEDYLKGKYGTGDMNWGTMTYTADDGGVYQLVRDTRYTPNWPIVYNAVQYTSLGDANFNVARFYVIIEDVTPETYTVEYKWVTGSEEPVDLPTTQTNLESLAAVDVAGLPTAEGYTITGWHVANNKSSSTVAAGKQNLSSLISGTGTKVTLYAYCEAKGDLEVVKTLTSVNDMPYVEGASVKVGDELTYTITVTNTGNKTLTNIRVSDTPGAGLTLSPGAVVGGTIASLAKGASETYTVTATVQASASGGSVTNTATAECGTLTDSAEVTTNVESALSITKIANKTTVIEGDTVTYTITVTNNTRNALTGIQVADVLPFGLTNTDNSFDTFDLAALASEELTVQATVATNQAGSLTNTATATCGTLSASDTATVTVVSTGDLTVTKAFNYDGATPDADDVTTVNGVTTPKDFAATLTLKQDDTVVKTANYVNGVFSFTDVPYGTYTVEESVTAGKAIDGTKDSQTGTLTQQSYTLTSVTIDEETETATITNNYTFAASNEVKVYYEWGTEGLKEDHKAVTAKISLPADATLTYHTDAHTGYVLPTFTASNLPDGYEVDTTHWYKDQACTVVADNDDVRDLLGGQSVTLYAKLTYGDPDYQLRYHLFYGEDGEEPIDTSLYAMGTMPVLESYTPATIFAAASPRVLPSTGETLYAVDGTAVSDADAKYFGLTYEKKSNYVGEITADGKQANGKYQYTINVYANRATMGDLTVTKTFSGVEALPEDFQITLEFTREIAVNAIHQEDITVVLTTGADSDVAPTVNGKTYTWVLEYFPYDTEVTVTETNYEVDSYSVAASVDGTRGDSATVTFTQANDTIEVVNDYTGTEYRVIFLAGDHGIMNIPNNSNHSDDDYTRYIWVRQGSDTLWTVNQNGSGAVQSNEAAHFDFDQSELDGVDIAPIDALNAPGVTADNNWSFDSFQLLQDGQIRNTAYPASLAALMVMFGEYAEYEDGVLTLTFEATYSRENDGDNDPPIVWPDPDSTPDTDLPDEDTPTTDLPDEGTPTTDLPDEDTPTTDLPDEETPLEDLPDEETPLADVPATGDSTGVWVLAAGVFGVALVWVALSGKKRREDNV